ncbi:MAG: carbon-nitrogen hydrolase family protein, partial [Sphingomonas sp.]|nr:carbon-nitrogen hydrolase family protein [Sphingomonas sp.]
HIHVAAWPSAREMYAVAARHYAFEGRCFVLSAATIQHRDDLLDGLARVGGEAEAEALIRQIPEGVLQTGGSAIYAPDGAVLAQAGSQAEIIAATLDMGMIARELAALDSDGHYSRPDVFELRVNRRATPGVVASDG